MLRQRSLEPELIDLGPDYYSYSEYIDCLKKLFSINKILGFFGDTVRLLRRYSKTSHILDVGCGGGLFILHLSKRFPDMKMEGVDINPIAVRQAQAALRLWKRKGWPAANVSFRLQNKPELEIAGRDPDIILVTLVCHHLTDDELIQFLARAYHRARCAVLINDLQRSSIAYGLYWLMSPWAFRNRLISHDGLISIKRGFTRTEWRHFLEKAKITQYQIKWRFPFRWSVILHKRP